MKERARKREKIKWSFQQVKIKFKNPLWMTLFWLKKELPEISIDSINVQNTQFLAINIFTNKNWDSVWC